MVYLEFKGMLDYCIWQVRLLYMEIVYFSYLDLYSLAYIRPHLVRVILNSLIYKDSSLSSILT